MENNEILKIYGTSYKEMTLQLLQDCDLEEILEEKRKRLQKEKMDFAVYIKPNLVSCTPADFGATTHPEIVEGVIVYLQSIHYNNIRIAEGSWVGDKTEEAFEYCGYNTLSQKTGVPLFDCQKDSFYEKDCGGMELRLCQCTADMDFLINVPVLKGHCQTKVTCALKNMKGLIPNTEKRRFHSMGLHDPIAHLNTGIYQDFIVVDHICGDPDMEDGGNPCVVNCIMAATDPVAVDAYAASVLGYEPSEIAYIGKAERLGVGSADRKSIHIIIIGEDGGEPVQKKDRVIAINCNVEEVNSCSACYEMLCEALSQLKEDGIEIGKDLKIGIGQGYRGKKGFLGTGNCTAEFEHHIPGCPPKKEAIYDYLKEFLVKSGEKI